MQKHPGIVVRKGRLLLLLAMTASLSLLLSHVRLRLCLCPHASLEGVVGHETSIQSTKQETERTSTIIRKSRGLNWEIWDGTSVLFDKGRMCQWTEFWASDLPEGRAPGLMCLYPTEEDIHVSGSIERSGHWYNCNGLTHLLQMDTNKNDKDHAQRIYVDIGANIGACVMQILFTTQAHVIAFEPSPSNLFRLTSTLMNLPQEFKERVTLFPVALGDVPSSLSIMTNPTNAGNTQVQRSPGDIGADGATVFMHNITVERVDDLLSPDLHVDLIKMDVQGYECFVVDGMKHALKNTQHIQFEVDDTYGTRFRDENEKCFGSKLVKKLQELDFDITTEHGSKVQDLTSLSDTNLAGVSFRGINDMYGVKKLRQPTQ